jgi:hypothetical protein
VTEEFRRLAPKREVSFRSELVDGQAALFEPNLTYRRLRKTDAEVTGSSESTFGATFKPTFGADAQQAEES